MLHFSVDRKDKQTQSPSDVEARGSHLESPVFHHFISSTLDDLISYSKLSILTTLTTLIPRPFLYLHLLFSRSLPLMKAAYSKRASQ